MFFLFYKDYQNTKKFMKNTEQVILLKTGNFREYDVWIRYLSATQGVSTAFAFGGRKSHKRFFGCLDSIHLVLASFEENRNKTYIVATETSLIHGFSPLKQQRHLLGVAMYCIRFVEKIHTGFLGAEECYTLLKETLFALEENPSQWQDFPFYFRLLYTFEQGYAVDFTSCSNCSATGERKLFFISNAGSLFCEKCLNSYKEKNPYERITYFLINREQLENLVWICTHRPLDWKDLHIAYDKKQELMRIIDAYSQAHLDLSYIYNTKQNITKNI